ncbi:hypothetical protein DVB69_10815 [Sporosarcina sp. BI001-red]|uniref:hypothetical protein n=1 Tax=Sporosarcina sp. BI001-red TaxID=2282866 RepID=UPI000E25E584|nr:hypothetical protein [Sporosarcina sp. BI001-red]REB07324.1 hypothetical protein DVB69_10815 [Sporosarcina sp. BI001-red]
MLWGSILLWIIGLFILYVVIFTAVKDGIDKSQVGQLIRTNYGMKDQVVTVSDEEIEKEIEEEFKNQK